MSTVSTWARPPATRGLAGGTTKTQEPTLLTPAHPLTLRTLQQVSPKRGDFFFGRQSPLLLVAIPFIRGRADRRTRALRAAESDARDGDRDRAARHVVVVLGRALRRTVLDG